MNEIKFKTEKLTRDRIPEFMENKGGKLHCINLDDEQFLAAFKKKLVEEVNEVEGATNTMLSVANKKVEHFPMISVDIDLVYLPCSNTKIV